MKRTYILLTSDYHKIGEYKTREEAFAVADWLDTDTILEVVLNSNDTEWELD